MLKKLLPDASVRLANHVLEVGRTGERLQEERLAAMGRLSSSICASNQNPGVIFAGSISTAKPLSGAERDEMFETVSGAAAFR